MKKVSLTTKPIVTKVDGVNRLIIHIFFATEYKKEDYVKSILLNRLLLTQSKKYDTPEKQKQAMEDAYIIKYDVSRRTLESHRIIQFMLSVPKVGIVDDFTMDKALEFLHEMIFNPRVENEMFDEKFFNDEKAFLLENQSEFPRDIGDFAYNEYDKFVDPEEKNLISHETYMKELNKVTAKDVFDYYNRIINNNDYFTLIAGAVDNEEELINTYEKYFKQESKDLNYDFDYFSIEDLLDHEEKTIETKYNQSMLFMHFNIKDYKEEEYFKLVTLGWLLDSKENNLVFHKLRIEHGLVYYCNCDFNSKFGSFDIITALSYEDVDKAKELIIEVIDSLKDEKLFDECKNRTLVALEYDLLTEEDNPFSVASNKVTKLIDYRKTIEEELEELKNIKYDDILDLINRIINTKVMIIKGGDNHE